MSFFTRKKEKVEEKVSENLVNDIKDYIKEAIKVTEEAIQTETAGNGSIFAPKYQKMLHKYVHRKIITHHYNYKKYSEGRPHRPEKKNTILKAIQIVIDNGRQIGNEYITIVTNIKSYISDNLELGKWEENHYSRDISRRILSRTKSAPSSLIRMANPFYDEQGLSMGGKRRKTQRKRKTTRRRKTQVKRKTTRRTRKTRKH